MIFDKSTNITWLGETHGVIENYDTYRQALIELQPDILALEVPPDFAVDLRQAVAKYSHYEDGRISHELILFLANIKTKIKLVCFDVRSSNDQQTNEELMASELIKHITPTQNVVVVTGSFHAIKQLIELKTPQGTIHINPMAKIVADRGHRIKTYGLKYPPGKFYNYGLKEMPMKQDLSLFDSHITLKSTTPVHLIK